jgi:UDP-N-acetylmuramate--alanine ligase
LNLNNLHKIYFLGIGGIGMSALARYFNSKGMEVHGFDRVQTDITNALESEGISIHYEDDVSKIPEALDLVVYTPAMPQTSKEWAHFKSSNIPMKKRSQVIGIISQNYFTIAIAGTHGKTTTSSILSHILKQSKKEICCFIGGISKNYDSNFILSDKDEYMIVEADEFDRSFLELSPDIAIVTSMDADHLDIYGTEDEFKKSFFQFMEQVKEGGSLITRYGVEIPESWDFKAVTYSSKSKEGIFYIDKVRKENGKQRFSINGLIAISNVEFYLPGKYNLENALAAIIAAEMVGCSKEQIINALKSYTGVKRRFDIRLSTKEIVYIDDYAHHPEEIKACISAVRDFFPWKRLTGVFQPHLFTRTRDFADEFAHSLDLLDEIILLDIYPAREEPIEGVSSQLLLEKMKNKNKRICSKEELVKVISNMNPEVLLTMGAGDIDQLVKPIEEKLKEIF